MNKLDLLEKDALPDEIAGYAVVVPIFAVSAASGAGLEPLGRALADGTTVLAGHSGVGKSSLLNAPRPELRLETGEISAKWDRGRHTTSRSTWLRLRGGGVVIDTPGVREIGTGPVDLRPARRGLPGDRARSPRTAASATAATTPSPAAQCAPPSRRVGSRPRGSRASSACSPATI